MINDRYLYECLVAEYGYPKRGIRLDPSFRRLLESMEAAMLRYVLERSGGHLVEASRMSGLNRATVKRKAGLYGIDYKAIRRAHRNS